MSEYNIELLGWLPVKDRLKSTLERAFAAAGKADRPEVEIEYLLAALLEDVDAVEYFAKHNVDREELRKFCIGKIGETAMPEPANAIARTNAQAEIANMVRAEDSTAFSPPSSANNYYGATARQDTTASFSDTAYSHETHSQNYSATANNNRAVSSNGFSYNAYSRDRWSNLSPAPSLHRPEAHAGMPANSFRNPSFFAPQPPTTASSSPQLADARMESRAVKPQASLALRRLMAQASDFAERDKLDLIDSETVIRAIAVDCETDSGRFLRSYLKPWKIGDATIGHLAAAERDAERAAAQAAVEQALLETRQDKSAVDRPAFDIVVKCAEEVMQRLHRELQQKNSRYRLVNDLSDYITSRSKGALVAHDGSLLGHIGHPILREVEAELSVDPSFQAHEQLRETLRALNKIQALLNERLVRLQDIYDENSPILEAIDRLIRLQTVVEMHTGSYEDTTPAATAGAQHRTAMREHTFADQAYSAPQEHPSQGYYDVLFVTLNEETAKADLSEEVSLQQPVEVEPAAEHPQIEQHGFWHRLFNWRKKNACERNPHAQSSKSPDTQYRAVEIGITSTAGESVNTGSDADFHRQAGKETATENRAMQMQANGRELVHNSAWRNSSRPTLLHTGVIALLLL